MDIRAAQILDGEVEPPYECDQLYNVLEEHRKNLDQMMLDEGKRQAKKHGKAALETYGLTEAFKVSWNYTVGNQTRILLGP